MGRIAYSIKDGLKQCNGPICRGLWLPATEEYFYPRRTGIIFAKTFVSPCIMCRRDLQLKHARKTYKLISVGKYLFVFKELEWRLGRTKTERKLGWQNGKMKKILEGEQIYVQRRTMEKAMKLLKELRDNGST